MNQIKQLCSLAADTQISVKKYHKTTVRRHNDVISENNGKVSTRVDTMGILKSLLFRSLRSKQTSLSYTLVQNIRN